MRAWFFLALLGCGGTKVDCGAGMHRSGDDCAPDRVFESSDSGERLDTGSP